MHLKRRSVLAGMSGLGLAACTTAPLPLAAPSRYADRPEMMAIGDSLYQGVRTMSFKPGLAAVSPPAQVARALGLNRFVIPDLTRPVLFDLEEVFFSIFPAGFEAVVYLAGTVPDLASEWHDSVGNWSANEAFDNVAIGGAGIENLWIDTYDQHWQTFDGWVAQGTPTDPASLFTAWYALCAAYTLNPRGLPAQASRTPIQQVADRKPRILLVNIGANEGLFNGGLLGEVQSNIGNLNTAQAKMTDLAKQLATLPPEIETIVFNSLLRPRFVPNLMPPQGAVQNPPGPDYYAGYGPWLFTGDATVSKALLTQFDQAALDLNRHTKSVLQAALGSRLVYVDLYADCERYDGKHYGNRGIMAGGLLRPNMPLTVLPDGTTSGGMAGLDNMHPTGPGYSIMAESVLTAMRSGKHADPEWAFQQDTLLRNLSGLIRFRQADVRNLYALIASVAAGGIAAPPPVRAARTRAIKA